MECGLEHALLGNETRREDVLDLSTTQPTHVLLPDLYHRTHFHPTPPNNDILHNSS